MIARPKPTRIISIDYGLARIGLAVSDETKMLAFPLEKIQCEKKTEDTAKKLLLAIKKHQDLYGYEVEKIVIGMPLMMNGSKGFLADEVIYFSNLLKTLVSYPIVTWDERLTSVQAEKAMKEANLSRKERAKGVDLVAAVIILQNYLDSIANSI